MAPRILHVDHAAVLGGAERSVLELVVAQAARGYTVTLALGGEGEFQQAALERGVHVVSLELPRGFVDAPATSGFRAGSTAIAGLLAASRRISAVVDDVEPDIVHVHTRKAQLATAAVPRHTSPVLYHLRDAVPDSRMLRLPIVLAVRRAAHAVALSPWMVSNYQRARALPRSGRIGVVPSGVDQRRLSALPTPWLDGTSPPRVGFVGQIASWKGPHLIVDLAESLSGFDDVSFHLIGRVLFPQAEQHYGEWLRHKIASSPARDKITWHPAAASPAEAMSEIDILVHTSLAPEPFGRVLVEAMASRRPVVAFRRGSTTDLLHDDTARLAVGNRVIDVVHELEKLLADRRSAGEMAARAAAAAWPYEPRHVAEVMEAEYARVMR